MRLSTATGDHNYIKANTQFFAVPYAAGGGGSLAVFNLEKTGKTAAKVPAFTGHTAHVLDFDFNPFHENIIASGSDDCTVKIWGIPEGGLTESIHDPLVDLHGHERKVSHINFHPTADNVLVSTSSDFSIRYWDIEKGTAMTAIEGFSNIVQDVAFNKNGSLLAVSCKDKALRLYDARTGTDPSQTREAAHEGSKTFKMAWLGSLGTLATVGFTRQSKRQFKIWDPRTLASPLATQDIDQAAGVIMPFYDDDTNMLYLAGKGDGNIRYYEMVSEAPYQFSISEYRSSSATKGACMLPKRACDTKKCEVARFLKLTSGGAQPLHFILPRKSEMFQSDIFPDTYAGVAAMTADEWWAGNNADPPTVSMNPANQGGAPAAKKSFAPVKTPFQLQQELDAANARIAELEAELAALKG
jgi:coronin-1B/1C/6